METSEHVRVYNAKGLGAAIRHFRHEAGLTQAELAAQVGVQRTYLSKLENGEMSEQVDRLIQLLKFTGARITVSKADW
jgi:transcriptional regulator with XRE-family HTH domain